MPLDRRPALLMGLYCNDNVEQAHGCKGEFKQDLFWPLTSDWRGTAGDELGRQKHAGYIKDSDSNFAPVELMYTWPTDYIFKIGII